MKVGFSAVHAKPYNGQQARQLAETAFEAKKIASQRYGSNDTVIINYKVAQDIVTFSAVGSEAKKGLVDSLVQNLLRKRNVPFVQK